MDWQPIKTAPFVAHTDDDDGSCEFGRSVKGAVQLMLGWDWYYHDPTHWRRRVASAKKAFLRGAQISRHART